MKVVHIGDYKRRRREEYPPIEELADAIYWADRGDKTKLDAYLAKVTAIKAKYPKEPPNDPNEQP
jgi:hypothetical protein